MVNLSTSNLEALRGYVAYIPQDDAFDEHLTILENLDYAASIRSPHLSEKDRLRRIDSKLIELGLSERRDSVVGSSVKKYLSGGERKRLNIGLDMISSADVYLFDEPTSGLSSKDSEHVIEIIKEPFSEQNCPGHHSHADFEDLPDVQQSDIVGQRRPAGVLRNAAGYAAIFCDGRTRATFRD